MKIRVENLGVLPQAEFTLGDLTIICGENNTGKTYATYALYGFLYHWRQAISIPIPEETIRALLSDGAVHIDVAKYRKDAVSLLEKGCAAYTERLPDIFAASKERFKQSRFLMDIDPNELDISGRYESTIGGAGKGITLFSLTKVQDSANLIITLLVEEDAVKIPQDAIMRVIGDALKEILFGSLFPNPFIASAERTGVVIFRNDLHFSKGDSDSFEVSHDPFARYSLTVNKNAEFVQQLEAISRKIGFIAENHPEILSDFSDIIGGEYVITQHDQLYFVPKGKRGVKLTMDESSSAVRSLLDIGFYLKHMTKPGDILMVDEPELNLHPENQRRIARLFARLVNIGIKVFVTTHSDYLIKELNTLIMLNDDMPHLKRITEQEGYQAQELLCPDRIRVYIAEELAEEELMEEADKETRRKTLTFTPADIDSELGIEVGSFDKTISTMNRIQRDIFWSDE
uniref:AAA domain-containing protein, putative AbiEii toxin, Type IV TA system n=1 Tax=Candidatus Kentrum sp. MB TaxID=2138164 RepID=A0A450XP09_9GAMM|nr:MAG: AAA domain-containing protein, putative AbiEii toxin, Type IV TA system [Candidatus Kentron sp. MB]VFK35577.1 MAG: AAA domain-containing protein, putative AbiEii toxin, Type IV TA system [Candidatus Kentron sp. MB]VFK77384.1 MAG: AAA domain-containing protein, putative AbiEii toxin, Type IV TA system [Candidatus Kentron sp. MB]